MWGNRSGRLERPGTSSGGPAVAVPPSTRCLGAGPTVEASKAAAHDDPSGQVRSPTLRRFPPRTAAGSG